MVRTFVLISFLFLHCYGYYFIKYSSKSVDTNPGDEETHWAVTVSQCERLCEQWSLCKSFTYSAADGNCTLYKQDRNYFIGAGDYVTQTGVDFHDRVTSCYFEKIVDSSLGFVNKTTSAADYLVCQQHCLDETTFDCKSVNYYTSTSTCELNHENLETVTSAGQWNQDTSSQYYDKICPDNPCQSGWFTWRGQCYKFVAETTIAQSGNTWLNAIDKCTAESSVLTSINSPQEMDFIASVATKHYPNNEFFIGLSYGVHGNEWIDGSATFYTNFDHGHGVTKKVVCYPNQLLLKCPIGKVLRIHKANYGRTSSNVPNCEVIKHMVDCISPSSFTIIHNACHNKTSCSVEQSTAVFGDPCVGERKYIEVDYDCVEEVSTCAVLDPSAGFAWKDVSCNKSNVGFVCKKARQTYSPLDCTSVSGNSQSATCPADFPQGVACRCSCANGRWKHYRRICDCSLCSSNAVSVARCCKPHSGYSPGPDYRASVECIENRQTPLIAAPSATCPANFPTATDCSCGSCNADFEITNENTCNCSSATIDWATAQCCRIVYTPRSTGDQLIEKYLTIDGIVIDGHDNWTPSGVTSEDECLQACENQVGCNSAEFKSSDSTCRLSGSAIKHVGLSGLLQQQSGYTYYERLDGEGDIRNYFHKFDGVYLSGVTAINTISDSQLTMTSCMTICLEDSSCKSTDFDSSTKTCYLRSGNSFDGTLTVSRYYYHFDLITSTPDPFFTCDTVKSSEADANQFSCGAIATWMDHFTYVQTAILSGYNDELPNSDKNACLKQCHNSASCKTIDYYDNAAKTFVCHISYSDRFAVSAYLADSAYFEHFIFDSYRGNYVKDSFLRIDGKAMRSSNFASYSSKTVNECMQLCFDNPTCKSFDYKSSNGGCYLGTVTRHTESKLFTNYTGFDYYEFTGRRAYPTDCSCSDCASYDYLNDVTGCKCHGSDNWGMVLCCHAKSLRRPPCKPGTYSPTGYHGVIRCLPCPAGTFSFNTGSMECQKCPAGYYSGQGQTQCTPCDYGSISNISRTACEPCPSGYKSLLGKCLELFQNYRIRPDVASADVSELLPETTTSSAEACRQYCEHSVTCVGFTYNAATGACSPKKYIGTATKQHTNETNLFDAAVALPWNCGWVVSSYVAEPNLASAVGPMPLANCSQHCVDITCAGFFISPDGYCVFMSSTPSDLGNFDYYASVHGSTLGWDYFSRMCSLRKQRTMNMSIQTGKTVTGHGISSFTVLRALDCIEKCMEDTECKSISFTKGMTPNCILNDVSAHTLKSVLQEEVGTIVYSVVP